MLLPDLSRAAPRHWICPAAGLSEGPCRSRTPARCRLARAAGAQPRHVRPAGPAVDRPISEDAAGLARRLSHDRCGGHRHLRRQGAQPEGARHQLRARRQPHQPHRAHDRRHGLHGVRDGAHRGRGAAAGSQPDQALPPALQRAAAGRQVVPLHPDRPRAHARRRSSSTAARATARATISGRSPPPAPSTAPSTCWSGHSCCARARMPCSRAARGPACCYQIKRCSAPCTGEIGLEDYSAPGRGGGALPARREPERARRCISG